MLEFIRSRRFWYNVLGIIAFYMGFFLLFALFVQWYTEHGSAIDVPDVRGKNFEEAVRMLNSSKLNFEIADSSFDDTKQPLDVMDQNPQPKSKVKEGRTIYLTVNSRTAPHINMPDLKDVSLKQASMILESYGLKVGKLTYKPDLAKDVVLQTFNEGKEIAANATVKKGSKIDLVLGDGLGQTQVEVPNLIGLTLREAKFVLDGSSLNLGALVLDPSVKSDTLDAVVYKQMPDPNDPAMKMMNIGEGVDVFLTSPQDYDSKNNNAQ